MIVAMKAATVHTLLPKSYGAFVVTGASSAAAVIADLLSTMNAVVPFVGAVSAAVAACTALVALYRVRELHIIVNSRLTELLTVSRESARAQGNLEGQRTERERHGEPKTP